eukprot:Tbor_TRINITY_DN3998_c0_g1::TRINITY_DN3998_c0_g1_i1::g.691::m.691
MFDIHHNDGSECVIDKDIPHLPFTCDANHVEITPLRIQGTCDHPAIDVMVDATPVRRMFANPKGYAAAKRGISRNSITHHSPYGRSGNTLVYYRDASSESIPRITEDDGKGREGSKAQNETIKNGTFVYNPNNGTVIPLHRPTRSELQQTRTQYAGCGNGDLVDVHHWSHLARNYEYHNVYLQQQHQLVMAGGSPSPTRPLYNNGTSPINRDAISATPLFQEYLQEVEGECGNTMAPNAYRDHSNYSMQRANSSSSQQRMYSYNRNSINYNKMPNKNVNINQINNKVPMLPVEELLTEYNYNRGANNMVAYACTQEGRVVLQQLLSLEGEDIEVPMPQFDSEEDEFDATTKTDVTPAKKSASNDYLDMTVEGVEFYGNTIENKSPIYVLYHFQHAHQLLEDIALDMETVALNEHGCHVVRSLLENLPSTTENVSLFVQTIRSETLLLNMCTMSQETRRIPQVLFEVHCRHETYDLMAPLVDIMSLHATYLAATQQGCIGFMRVFEACNADHKNLLMTPLVPLFADMACDPFGNYVVQCAVEHCEPHVAARYVTSSFTTQCVRLATNKYASNVMEKVIRNLTHLPSVRHVILNELIFDSTGAQICVEDGYGNFVLQAIIETSINIPEYRKISDRIRSVLTNSPYAPKIEAKLRSKGHTMGLIPNQAKPYDSKGYNGLLFGSLNELHKPISVVVGHPPNATTLSPPPLIQVKCTGKKDDVQGPVYTPSSCQSSGVAPRVSVNHSQERRAPFEPPMTSVVVGRHPSSIRDATDTENNARNIASNSAVIGGMNKKMATALLKAGVPAKMPSPEEIPTTFTPYKPSPFSGQYSHDNKKIQPRAFGNYVDRNI